MFIIEKGKQYSMPIFFGGDVFDPDAVATVDDFVGVSFTQVTCASKLEQYLPKDFKLLEPQITISFGQFRGCNWLSGGKYNLIDITVPVLFHGKCDHLEGKFPLVTWENNAYPITGGREDCGIGKIYADIEDLYTCQGKSYTSVSIAGNTFLTLEMFDPQPFSQNDLDKIILSSKKSNVFGYRYIRKVGAAGFDLCQPVLYPQSADIEKAWACTGTVKWTKLGDEKYHAGYRILEALSNLPIISTSVSMVKGSIVMRPNDARLLE